MKTSDFYYDLPQELIAQHPVEPRDSSRLMVMDRQSGALQHKIFRDVIEYLNPGDCLIVNDAPDDDGLAQCRTLGAALA